VLPGPQPGGPTRMDGRRRAGEPGPGRRSERILMSRISNLEIEIRLIALSKRSNVLPPLFKVGKYMTDQIQPVREMIIDILRRNGVKRASFFGSIVRGEMTEDSDVDLLVEFEGKKSLLDLAHLKNELEDSINRRVDLLTYKSLHPRLKDRILAEQVPIL